MKTARLTTTALAGALALTACSGLKEPPRQEIPVVTAQTANAPQLQQVQAAGRELVRQHRLIRRGDEPQRSAAARRAVQTALAVDTMRCAEGYQALTLEGDAAGGPGEGLIAVYLVPTPADDDAVPIGGFHRITVDAASGQVVHRAAMTPGCLDLSLRPGGAATGATVRTLLVNHGLTPYPLENHVYASMVSAVELVVVTPSATWRVADGRVKSLD